MQQSAEDIAFMLEAKSGGYMCIDNEIISHPTHSLTYVFNEECIPFGIGFWNKLVQLELKS